MSEPLQAFDYHVSGTLTVNADITVLARTREEGDQKVRDQLNLRDSRITDELSESAGQQIRKEMRDSDFTLELTDTREPTDDDE